MEMEDLAQNPKRILKIGDLAKGIVAWDIMRRELKDAGGETMSDARQVNILAKMMPTDFKQHALWDFEQFRDNPSKLRGWIETKIRDLVREVPETVKQGARLLDNNNEEP